MEQQLNYDDIIDGFADAKARKVHFWGMCYKSVFLLFNPEPIDCMLLVARCAIQVASSRNY
jgi:hypothetical protein